MRITPLSSVFISGLVLTTKKGDAVIAIDHATGHIAILPLLKRRIVLTELSLTNPRVDYNQRLHPNLADVFTVKSVSNSQGPAWTFMITKFFIDSLQAHYGDSTGHSTNVRCAKLTGGLSATSVFTLNVNGSSLRAGIPEHSIVLDTFYLSMHSSVRSFYWDTISFKSSKHMTAQGAFAIPYDSLDTIRADILFRADNAFFAGINARSWGLDRCDFVTVSAHAYGPFGHPKAAMDAEVNTIVLQKIALDHAKIHLSSDSLGTTVGRLSLADQALSGTFTLSTRIYNLFSKPFMNGYHVDGNVLIPNIGNLNRVITTMSAPSLLRKGAARLAVTASGASFKQIPSAHCVLGLADMAFSNGKTMQTASLQADIVHDAFVVKGEWPEVFTLQARGSLIQDKGWGNGTLDITDIRPLTVLLINKEIHGALKGDFSMHTFLSAPSAKVGLLGTGITWEGLVVDNLKTDFSYTGKTGLTIDAASADLRGPLENAFKNIGRPGIRGYMTASLTAQGPALYPNAVMHVSIDSLVSGTPIADLMSATITLHDSVVLLNDLKLVKGLALIGGSVSFDRAGKNVAADLAISSGVKGLAPGTISIKGGFADNTISNGACTATDVPLDVAHAWFPLTTIPSAKLSLQASMNGKFSNPSVIAAFQLSEIALIKTDVKPNFKGKVKLAQHQVFALCTLSVEDSCGPLTLSAHASVLSSLRLDTLAPLPLEIKVYGSNVCLQPYVRAFSKDIVMDGSFNANGAISFHHGAWTPEGAVSIVSNKIAYPPLNLDFENISLQMKPRGNAALAGTRLIDISLQTGHVQYAAISLPKTTVQAVIKNNVLIIDTADIFFEKGAISITGYAPIIPFRTLSSSQDLRMALRIDSVGAINFNPFINGGRFTSGTINGQVIVSPGHSRIMNVGAPTGALTADNVMFAVDDITPAIGPLQFTITLSGDSVVVNGGGSWGKGKITETGYLTLSNNSLCPSKISISSKDLQINYLDDTQIRIDTLAAVASNPLGAWFIDGSIMLGESKVMYEAPFNQSVIAHANVPLSRKKSPALNIRLAIPHSLSTDLKVGSVLTGSASEVQTSITGTLLVTGTADNPKYAGLIQIDGGTAIYAGHIFTVKQGYARLTGSNEINPFLDVTATTTLSQAQTAYSADSVVITLRISGDLKRPVISLTSNKGFSQIEIISLLTFGSTTFSLTGAGATGSTSLISGALSTIVSSQAQKKLGLEQVQFQGNLFATGSSQANAAVSVSKKISPAVTITYSGGIADTIAQQGVVSWKLKPFLFLEFESNDRGNAGIDLKYRIKR